MSIPPSLSLSLSGRTAVVTGAGRGIGLACATLMGAIVIRLRGPQALWPAGLMLLALVWGPRFDRDHARHLAAPLVGRFPHAAGPVLDALMDVGERFDRLEHAAQQRIRRLILRHRALSDALH